MLLFKHYLSTRVGWGWFGEGVWFKWDKANSTPLELGLGLSLKISGPLIQNLLLCRVKKFKISPKITKIRGE